MLNWDNFQLMVTSSIVLGLVISHKGIVVDKAKIDIIRNLPTPKIVKTIKSFLGQVNF